MIKGEIPDSAVNRDRGAAGVDERLSRSTERAIGQLLRASNYAADIGCNVWEFAVTIGELRRDSVRENELRWLICRGYIEHAEEIATRGNERAFDRNASLRLCEQSAFVITSAGVEFSREINDGFTRCEASDAVAANTRDAAPQMAKLQAVGSAYHGANGNARPKWDRDRRELRFGGQLVKVFKLPSPMQEAILMAFEEEHWPPRIDDPLPVNPELLPKRRLHDTIKSLNRNQKSCLLRFMGDGTGEGVRWELVSSRDDAEHPNLLQ